MKTSLQNFFCFVFLSGMAACGTDDSNFAAVQGNTPTNDNVDSLENGRPDHIETARKAYDNLEFDFEDYVFGQEDMGVWSGNDESRYQQYKAAYENLWKTISLRADKLGTVDWYVNTILQNKARYQKIEQETGVPWFWVGITHGLEGGFDFSTHLHNGDPLRARTVQVPAGRPASGKPPFTWEFSATDALRMKSYDKWTDWDIVSVLAYSFEKYNGFGYRTKGINSPYLWSFTNHYSKGKYTYDGYYDRNAVSQQAGAMAILKRGLDRGLFKLLKDIPAVTVKSTDRPELSRVLSVGMAPSNDVLLLELRLKSFGYFSGVADKVFDSATVTAVKQFQQRFGLMADGAVGAATWSALWPAVSGASWLKVWGDSGILDLRAMSGDRCLFKVKTKETAAVVDFMRLTIGANTISAGGELALADDLPNDCPDYRELYDVKAAVTAINPQKAPALNGNKSSVTWHKLYRGAASEWIVSSFAGGSFVNAVETKSKAAIINHLLSHSGAVNLIPAKNTEVPVKN